MLKIKIGEMYGMQKMQKQ